MFCFLTTEESRIKICPVKYIEAPGGLACCTSYGGDSAFVYLLVVVSTHGYDVLSWLLYINFVVAVCELCIF